MLRKVRCFLAPLRPLLHNNALDVPRAMIGQHGQGAEPQHTQGVGGFSGADIVHDEYAQF